MSELQFRPEMVLVAVHAETHCQWPGDERPLFSLVADPDVVAHRPAALLGLQMLNDRGLGRVFEQGGECAFPVVVILAVEVHDGLPFHVRLTGQDEHLHRPGLVGGPSVRNAGDCKKSEENGAASGQHVKGLESARERREEGGRSVRGATDTSSIFFCAAPEYRPVPVNGRHCRQGFGRASTIELVQPAPTVRFRLWGAVSAVVRGPRE